MMKRNTTKLSLSFLTLLLSHSASIVASSTVQDLVGPLDQVIDTKVFKSHNGANYTVTTSGFSASAQTPSNETDYYYYLSQLYNLTPSRKVLSYAVELIPAHTMITAAAYPNTTIGDVSDSKSESVSLGANVGFFDDVVTGGVDVSYTITTSHSFSAPAIKTAKYLSAEGNVKWTFDIAPESPSNQATFSPNIAWVWKAKKEDTNNNVSKEPLTFTTNILALYADGGSDNFLSYKLNIATPPEPGERKKREPLPLPANVHEDQFIRTEGWPNMGNPLSSVVSYSSEISGFKAIWNRNVIVAIVLKFKDGTSTDFGLAKSNPLLQIPEILEAIEKQFPDVDVNGGIQSATLRNSGFGYTSLRQIHLKPLPTNSLPVEMGPGGFDNSIDFDFDPHKADKVSKWRGIEISRNPDCFITGLSFITSIEKK